MPHASVDAPENMISAWENTIRQGNQAYSQKQDQLALKQYQAALDQAKSLLRECVHTDELAVLSIDTVFAAYVVSYHNLANVYARQGDINTAACRLCEAHQCLSRICSDPDMSCALREAAQRHGRRTYKELVNFSHLYSQHPLVARTLRICGEFCTLQKQPLH
ncbi:hypothetical protein LG198_10525 [Methylobacillus arboreus]|uniref:hypothetical protein n=1 Tax=Methylobacillus arboreus TaxID=755170 RepID=UPI001E52019E|nr:hypothetical protein [Methylobacillus arboreus]MCB5191162.1 hypothetical protein [Methylobacillus arboreus]